MKSHEIDYRIYGDDMQIVEVELDQGETVIAEAGAMLYMDEGIQFEAKMGDGSDVDQGFFGKVFSAAGRKLMGESVFLTHFTATRSGKSSVAFAAPYPGKIVPIDLPKVGGTFICQKDSFLSAALGTKISLEFNKRLGAGFFGGEGFILQRITGDGKAFIHSCGTVIRKTLKNEKLLVDTGCLVGFTEGIDYDIQRAGNLKSMIFGGEGLFLASLSGTGTVLLQSLPFSRLAERVIRAAPGMQGKSQGEGSVLGKAARIFED